MFCRFCGCEVPEKSVFCSRCGNKIDRPDYPEEGFANEPIQPYDTPDTERDPSLSDHSTEDALARARSSKNDQPRETNEGEALLYTEDCRRENLNRDDSSTRRRLSPGYALPIVIAIVFEFLPVVLGFVGYFAEIFPLLVIGAILCEISIWLLKGAPYPRFLLYVISFIIVLVLAAITKKTSEVLNSVLLVFCVNSLVVWLYSLIAPKKDART